MLYSAYEFFRSCNQKANAHPLTYQSYCFWPSFFGRGVRCNFLPILLKDFQLWLQWMATDVPCRSQTRPKWARRIEGIVSRKFWWRSRELEDFGVRTGMAVLSKVCLLLFINTKRMEQQQWRYIYIIYYLCMCIYIYTRKTPVSPSAETA